MHKTKNHARWALVGLLNTAVAGFVCQAQLPIVSVDMDTVTAGIQNTLFRSPGDPSAFTVALMLQAGGAGVSSYSVSAQFDNTELTYSADVESLPAGFTLNITPGSGGLTIGVAPGVNQVSSFEAATFGAGPVLGAPFQIGTITFTQGAVADDGLADITLWVAGFDTMFDNTVPFGLPLVPVSNAGFLIPEPGVIYGAALLMGFAGIHYYRKRR